MTEHADVVAVGLLQDPGRWVEAERLGPEHLDEPRARSIFSLARQYRERAGGKNSLDLALARSLLEASPNEKARKLLPVVEEYMSLASVTDAEFRDAVQKLLEGRRKKLTKERATEAVEASIDGDDERAREAMRRALLEAEDAEDDRPEDVRSREGILAEVAELRKPPDQSERFDVGFRFLTDRTSFRRGHLTVIGGSVSDGKTMCAKTFAYNAATLSGAHVLFASLEMDKREMRSLFVCHHASTLDPKGVRWARILDKTASPEEMKLYARALKDFEVRSGTDGTEEVGTAGGGSIWLWTPKRRPTMAHFADRVRVMAKEEGLGAAFGDYLELFLPSRRTKEYRHDLTEMAYEAKEMAVEANVWVAMCHQISRAGREAAEKRIPKHYIMRDLGESSGVEKASNSIVWMFSSEDFKAEKMARMGLAKARGGATCITGEEVYFDPALGYLAATG
jgi:replicative DNA helicase